MKKSKRLQLIKEMVKLYPIDTQEEIVERLREAGIVATQATVSRDIKELGIVKIPTATNGYIYGLAKTTAARMGIRNVTKLSTMDNMLNIEAIPGSTVVIKRQILDQFAEDIFSVIADDNSVLVITKQPEMVERIKRSLEGF